MIADVMGALVAVTVLAVVVMAVCGALWAWTGWRTAIENRHADRLWNQARNKTGGTQ